MSRMADSRAKKTGTSCLFALAFLVVLSRSWYALCHVQTNPQAQVPQSYERLCDLVYKQLGSRQLRLDLYRSKNLKRKNATVIYFHGGGWQSADGDKNKVYWLDYIVPWMNRGFEVVMV